MKKSYLELAEELKNAEAYIESLENDILESAKDVAKAVKKADFHEIEMASKWINRHSERKASVKATIETIQAEMKQAEKMESKFAPIAEYLEDVYEQDLKWHKEIKEKLAEMGTSEFFIHVGQNKSVMMIARMSEKEASGLFRQDLEFRYAKLVKQIESKVGTVKELNLERNENSGMDGWVAGDEGTARLATHGAGGYNIQRFHFRTKVTLEKAAAAK